MLKHNFFSGFFPIHFGKKYIKHNSSLCLLWYLLTYHYLPSSSHRPRVFTQLNVTPRIQKWKITWRLCEISLTKPKNIHNSISLRFDDDNWQMRWRYILTTDDLFFFLENHNKISSIFKKNHPSTRHKTFQLILVHQTPRNCVY